LPNSGSFLNFESRDMEEIINAYEKASEFLEFGGFGFTT
jgi:hypothetical protein